MHSAEKTRRFSRRRSKVGVCRTVKVMLFKEQSALLVVAINLITFQVLGYLRWVPRFQTSRPDTEGGLAAFGFPYPHEYSRSSPCYLVNLPAHGNCVEIADREKLKTLA